MHRCMHRCFQCITTGGAGRAVEHGPDHRLRRGHVPPLQARDHIARGRWLGLRGNLAVIVPRQAG
eukprot:CAMPEP_0194543732 /NCGR_PEP_ID=MMETSP0253-20130528/86315_1 /TAXON_ID=2966 /ORGANISM="Noctiluca scintillans" /LENGTH=64 /DNA_ID=CAMNT_0039390525 /DNA_START=53 /DNA_END=243 /DNA_ORIENTATION=+